MTAAAVPDPDLREFTERQIREAILERTARRFGVRVVLVERPGTEGQHIDLCGKPLERARELARQLEFERKHQLDGIRNLIIP